MSLISQRDRELTINALTCYKDNSEFTEQERMEINALLNWIKLEYSKNDSKNNTSNRA